MKKEQGKLPLRLKKAAFRMQMTIPSMLIFTFVMGAAPKAGHGHILPVFIVGLAGFVASVWFLLHEMRSLDKRRSKLEPPKDGDLA